MLALFRNNQSTTSLLLALYVLLLHLPAILSWAPPPADRGDAGVGILFPALFGWMPGKPLYSALAAAVLVFGQALMVNRLADEFRIAADRNWLPGALYALVASAMVDFCFVSPPLVAATFVPLALRGMFRVYKRPAATALIFDVGFWTATASLFYPPAFWLLLPMYAGINSLRAFQPREQIVFASGVFTPFFLGWVGCFWFDRGGDFWPVQFGQLFGPPNFGFDTGLGAWLKLGLGALLLILVLLSYQVYYYKKLIQVQKYISNLYWLLGVTALTATLYPGWRAEHFLLAMPALGIFLSMTLAAFRRPFIAEILHLAMLAAIFALQFYSF